MLFANTKTWMSILLACSSIHSAQCAPTSNTVNAVVVRDIQSLPAVVPALSVRDISGVSRVITERDAATDVNLAKRYLIGSPHQKRTIELVLKQAVHGLAAGTTWLWEISYGYTSTNGGSSGHLTGNLVRGDGSFSWGTFRIDHSFISSVDAIVTATFNAVVATTNQKVALTLTWAEEFTSQAATLSNHGSSSGTTYYSPSGRQEHLSQDFFSYSLKQS
jgi:hypothetical protein